MGGWGRIRNGSGGMGAGARGKGHWPRGGVKRGPMNAPRRARDGRMPSLHPAAWLLPAAAPRAWAPERIRAEARGGAYPSHQIKTKNFTRKRKIIKSFSNASFCLHYLSFCLHYFSEQRPYQKSSKPSSAESSYLAVFPEHRFSAGVRFHLWSPIPILLTCKNTPRVPQHFFKKGSN